MILPGYFRVNGDTKVVIFIPTWDFLSVHGVDMGRWFTFVGDGQYGAFADVEVHLPCFSPVVESADISCEGLVVTWVMDVTIQDTVVGKQSHGRAYSISDVINVQQEEQEYM